MSNRICLYLSGLSLVGLLCIAIYIYFFPAQRIAIVDSGKLIEGYKGMAAAKAEYQIKSSTWKSNIDTLSQEVEQLNLKYKTEEKSMTSRERSLSAQLIESKKAQLSNYERAVALQAQQEDARMTNQVVTEINTYLKKYSKKKGYAVLFAATQYGNVAFAEDGIDVTEEVLAGLNAEFPGNN